MGIDVADLKKSEDSEIVSIKDVKRVHDNILEEVGKIDEKW